MVHTCPSSCRGGFWNRAFRWNPRLHGAHWQGGSIESEVRCLQRALDRFAGTAPADTPTEDMFGRLLAERNDLVRIDGLSPYQRFSARTPLMGANCREEPHNLPLIYAETVDGEFGRNAELRRLARLAHIEGETVAKVNQAALGTARRPTIFQTGDLVYTWRHRALGKNQKNQAARGPGKAGRWYGPGRVLMQENRRGTPSRAQWCGARLAADSTDWVPSSSGRPPRRRRRWKASPAIRGQR